MRNRPCPVCNRNLFSWERCGHTLQKNRGLNVASYYVYYMNNKTVITEEYPYGFHKDKIILELDGFMEITMERVEKLLLLK